MPKTHRPAAYAAVLLGVALAIAGAAPTPAGAATRAQATRSKRAAQAAKLDALRATDRELTAAVTTLTGQVDAQIARVNAAKRAASTAEANLTRATAELEATENQIDQLHGSVLAQAVDTYMRPQGRGQPAVNSVDMAAASRQRALLTHVEKRQGDALDELRAARQDLAIREAVASRAEERATQRKRVASTQLAGLARDLRDKQRVSSALEARIRDAQSEDDAAAANDGSLRALLGGESFGGTSKAGLIWPLKGRLTSGFGRRWGRLHAGIDIAAPRGTPIRSARAGKVVISGWMGGYGNAVVINHGDGMATLYGHQSRRAVKVGQVVKQGAVIGYVGSTGHSTGNHLHFETRINGSAKNPRRYLP